jgi:hypothetical protein
MSAHNILQEQLIADRALIDPGNAGTVVIDRSPAILSLSSAVGTRILEAPQALGQEVTVSGNVITGNVGVTQAGSAAINAAGNTTATITAAGQRVTFIAIAIAGVLRWRVKSNDGATLS